MVEGGGGEGGRHTGGEERRPQVEVCARGDGGETLPLAAGKTATGQPCLQVRNRPRLGNESGATREYGRMEGERRRKNAVFFPLETTVGASFSSLLLITCETGLA